MNEPAPDMVKIDIGNIMGAISGARNGVQRPLRLPPLSTSKKFRAAELSQREVQALKIFAPLKFFEAEKVP